MPQPLPTRRTADGLRIAVLVARWYTEITDSLLEAALTTLREGGIAEKDLLVLEIPGAYELPQAASWVARGGDADAVVALGCVIRGETPHFDYVAGGCAEGLMRVALETGVPVALGVITAENHEQAVARSGLATGKGGNKGVEAAEAALRMATLFEALEKRRRER